MAEFLLRRMLGFTQATVPLEPQCPQNQNQNPSLSLSLSPRYL